MSEHDFCRSVYGEHCKAAGISQRELTVYGPMTFSHTKHFQVYLKNKNGKGHITIGEFVGCCAYDAKTKALTSVDTKAR